MDIVIIVLGTMFLTLKLANWYFREKLARAGIDIDNLDGYPQEADEPEMAVIDIKVEEHHGLLYAYREDNDKFLGQGSDPTSLFKRIAEDLEGDVRLNIKSGSGAEILKSMMEKEEPASGQGPAA